MLSDQDKVEDLHQLISETKEKGDTLGGIIRLVATGQLHQLGHEIGRQACRGRCRGQCHGQFRHDEPSFAGNFGRQLLCQSIDRGCFFKQAADEAGQPLAKFGAEIALSPAGTLPATVIGQKLHGAEI